MAVPCLSPILALAGFSIGNALYQIAIGMKRLRSYGCVPSTLQAR
jgi:hypothetical protein